MYPTLSDLLKDLFGIYIPLPIQTFGLFMGLAFVAAAFFWGIEFERVSILRGIKVFSKPKVEQPKNKNIEVFGNSFLFFLLGFKLVYLLGNYTSFVANPPAAILSLKGNLLAGIIAITAYLVYYFKSKPTEEIVMPISNEPVLIKPKELVSNLTLIAAIAGILGAKIFHNLENLDEFAADPLGSLISFSGLTWYGGLILATYILYRNAKKNDIRFTALMDSSVLPLLIGYALGRMGCQLAGDGDWGIDNLAPKPEWLSAFPDWIWTYRYPHNVINEGIPIVGCEGSHCMQLMNPVYPTPLYESMMCFTAFMVFWVIRKNFTTPGMFFALYLLFNGLERFLIELIRVNTEYNIMGGVTQAQIISTLLIITGIGGMAYLKLKINK